MQEPTQQPSLVEYTQNTADYLSRWITYSLSNIYRSILICVSIPLSTPIWLYQGFRYDDAHWTEKGKE